MINFNCPHCNFYHNKNDVSGGDLEGGEQDFECVDSACRKTFTITVEFEINVTASK